MADNKHDKLKAISERKTIKSAVGLARTTPTPTSSLRTTKPVEKPKNKK